MINKFTKKVKADATAISIKDQNLITLKSIIEATDKNVFATAMLEYYIGQNMTQEEIRKRIGDLEQVIKHSRVKDEIEDVQQEIVELEELLDNGDEEYDDDDDDDDDIDDDEDNLE